MTIAATLRLRDSFIPLFTVLVTIIILALVIDVRVENMAVSYQVVDVGDRVDKWDEGSLDDDGMNAAAADFAQDLETVSPLLNRVRDREKQGRYRDATAILNDALQKDSKNAVLLNELAVIQLKTGDATAARTNLDKAIAANNIYFRAYYNRAIAAYRLDNWQDAERDYLKAIELRPHHFESYYNLGLLQLKQHHTTDAYYHLKKAASFASGDDRASALFSLGRAQTKLGKVKSAIRSYERAIEYRPGYVLPRYNLALLHAAKNDNASQSKAQERLDEILALRPDFAPAYFVKARLAAAKQKDEDARHYYEKAVATDAMFWKARYNLALLHLDNGEYDIAKAQFLQMANDFPNKAEIFFNLGRIAYSQNAYDQAEKSYQKAMSLRAGNYAEAELNLGIVKKAQKKYDEAISIFDTLLNHQPEYSPAWLNKGLVLFRLQQFELARRAFETALANGASPVKIHYNLGRLAFKQNQYDQAITFFKNALSADAHHLNSAINLGVTYVKQNNYHAAAEAYKRAVKIAPNQMSPWLKLAITLRHLKRWREAALAYQQVVKLNDENTSAWHNLGVCLARSGKTSDAATVFEHLLDKDPSSVKARYNLALQLKKMKRYDEAKQHLKALLKLDATHFQSHISLADIYLIQNTPQNALIHLNIAKNFAPDNGDLKALYAQYNRTIK